MIKDFSEIVTEGVKTIIIGDIGGTNSRFQLIYIKNGSIQEKNKISPGEIVMDTHYRNCNYETFTLVFREFIDLCKKSIKEKYIHPTVACFAVAGPVDKNQVTFTNRAKWVIKGQDLEESENIPCVVLMNDFVANGYGLLTLDSGGTFTLQEAVPNPNSPIACLGAGTGLGETFLTPCHHLDGSYMAFPTEGGHTEFAPRNILEQELLDFLKIKFSHKHRVSIERLVSGPGIVSIFEFLKQKYPERVPPELDRDFDDTADVAELISLNAEKGNSLCNECLDIFVSTYGSEAGCLALKLLPFGGLYIAGGIARKMQDRIKSSLFMDALLDKGRVSTVLRQIPIKMVLVKDLGQRGAHYNAFRLLQMMPLS